MTTISPSEQGVVAEWLASGAPRPWGGETGMTTERWRQATVVSLDPWRIRPTQAALDPAAIQWGGSACGDVYPHVVRYGDDFWLDDGHHRVAYAIALRVPRIAVRLILLP